MTVLITGNFPKNLAVVVLARMTVSESSSPTLPRDIYFLIHALCQRNEKNGPLYSLQVALQFSN